MIVVSSDLATIKENTFYFPGWTVYDNSHKLKIDYQKSRYMGIITFNLTRGQHLIEVVFEDTPVVFWAKWISVLKLVALLMILSTNILKPKASSRR
jgi:hypothetical protein